MPVTNEKLEECIKACWACRHECQVTLFDHCLKQGGAYVAPDHVKIMADCIEICQTTADFMTRGSKMHEVVSGACADICEACADSCDELEGQKMKDCANTCRECADLCREMSGGGMAGTRKQQTGQSQTSVM